MNVDLWTMSNNESGIAAAASDGGFITWQSWQLQLRLHGGSVLHQRRWRECFQFYSHITALLQNHSCFTLSTQKCVLWLSGHKIGEDKTGFIFTTKMYYDSSKDIFIIYEDTFRFAINSCLEICWEIWLLNKVTFSLFPFSTSTVHY